MTQPNVDSAMTRPPVNADLDAGLALPVVRKIGMRDLMGALAKGADDFSVFPTHTMFLCIIFPVFYLVVEGLALSYDLLSLLFPLAAGLTLVGPFAATGLYELSRQRELGLDLSWKAAFGVVWSPSIKGILALGLLLVLIFVLWVAIAQAIYVANFGDAPTASIPNFLRQVFTTPAGWTLMIVVNGVGFVFAVAALAISVVSFPLLLDRHVSTVVAIQTSIQAVRENPVPLAMWGLIIAALLAIGSLPLFLGLAAVLPVLGHSSWHLYRRLVEPDPRSRQEPPRPPQ
jgi:uncharacterized membrane protein